jgi:hypothetical protein
MTDTDRTSAAVEIAVCPAGHVHLILLDAKDGSCGLDAVLSPSEAFHVGATLMEAAVSADAVLVRAMVEDARKCTRH